MFHSLGWDFCLNSFDVFVTAMHIIQVELNTWLGIRASNRSLSRSSTRHHCLSFGACFFIHSVALYFTILNSREKKSEPEKSHKIIIYVFRCHRHLCIHETWSTISISQNMCMCCSCCCYCVFFYHLWVVSSQSNVCCIVAALLNFRDDKILEHNNFMCCTIHVYCI